MFRKVVYLVIVVAAFALGYLAAGEREGTKAPVKSARERGATEERPAGKDVIWTCSMHPQIRLSEPGKCPICFMDLIPVKKDDRGAEPTAVSQRQITLSAQARSLAEVQVEPVIRRPVSVETRMVGKVDYDETRLGYITTWMSGRIDKLHVDYTGSFVRKGQPMASIYSPELLTAQAELIQALKAVRELEKGGLARVREAAQQTERAAREKLRLLGFTQEQIQEIIQKGTPSDHITLYAPTGGVVIKKDVLEGMYVQTGTRIYTIADLSRLWVILEAYESDLPWVKMGQQVEFQTDAYPGEVFKGVVTYVDPLVNPKTRTVSLRLDVPNPNGKLKPGMLVRAVKKTRSAGSGEELVIPATAPLITGKRAIVYVQVPGQEGTYEGREIVLGARAGDYYVVRTGLKEGERVVTKGNFKVDSAVQLQARPSMMNPQGVPTGGGREPSPGASGAGEAGQDISSPDVPSTFASQLQRLAASFETLKATLVAKDLQKTRQAYKVFYNELSAVNAESLQGPAVTVWKEAAMLLRNDSLLGAEADSNEEAERLFATLTEHFQAVKVGFRLDRLLQARSLSAAVPEEFKHKLRILLRSYLELQESLAKDDFQSARSAGRRFAEALEGVNGNLLKGEALQVWAPVRERLETGVQKITGARSIEGIRGGFERLSVGITGAVDRLGVETEFPLYEMFCPMAFDNKGATWLQRDDKLRNPYFGAQMLECGETRRQLRGGNS